MASSYRQVVGWQIDPVEMGEYQDYSMVTPGSGGDVVAGICHARGSNARIPPQWMIYITVDDIDKSAATCVVQGGEVVDGPRKAGDGKICIIRDPAGAVAALCSN